MAETAAVAVDAGGSKVASGLVSAAGEVLAERVDVHPAGARPYIDVALAGARAMLAQARSAGIEVVAIGAGFPEYVDGAGTLRSREVLEWDVQPHEALAEIGAGLPCVVESDVRAAALAEARCGAGAGLQSFLYVILGTGLSSCLVLGGEPWAGTRGEAIALGELGVAAAVDPRWDGNLEQFAAGSGIARRYAALTGTVTAGALDVERRAADGDGAAQQILDTAGRALGVALADLVRVLDPAAVIVGGGLGSAAGATHRALAAAYAGRLASRPGAPPLNRASLGARAGLVGAGLAAHERAGRRRAPPRS